MQSKEIIMETLKKFKAHLESKGLTVYAVMLKGSQNYNLSDSESDIDANAIIIPTLAQLRSNEKWKLSFEEGDVVAHNIYSFAEIVAKGNPQWVEVCNSEYAVGESLEMFKHFRVNPSALKGMMMEKVTAFSRLYPSRAKYVEQFGYDPKQLHHIIRLYDCLAQDVITTTYHGTQRDWMMAIKRGTLLTKEEAFALRDEYVTKLAEIYEKRKLAYSPQKVGYDLIDKIVSNHLVQVLH